MILFRNKKEFGHPILSVASLRVQKDMEELATKRYLAGYANVSVSIPYIQGIYICVPVSFTVKTEAGNLYPNGTFETIIKVTPGYPFKPPQLWVINKVYHPNVNIDTGFTHLRLLRDEEWKPVMTINSIIFAFELLLNQPDLTDVPEHPINLEMKMICQENFEVFKWRVQATLEGGMFFEKYFFSCGYGLVTSQKRIRKQSFGPTKRIKTLKDSLTMELEIELKNN